ncbi:GDP-L-fucose synthase [Pseudolysinimonas kribbensis]|uniref:GDP-L-fucose synthase n=1 Tax=Pseudolysinimonas kribbensis TaxID=433641 RepID=A0ABQ6K0X8_9MICO|nr:NAD-dependent epimerase/dehydratase family protein [Pseudolysinimonas kribbensis]GMA94257.1 GDP-L-fucose synthase [Pseudolysinimonas kribbensis]
MRVVLTGAGGMLGSSIVRSWARQRPGDELVPFTRERVDLCDAAATAAALAEERPDAVIHAAARVAGIADKLAGPDRFLAENLRIDDAVISGAVAADVPELLYVSSGAIYPADAEQPIREDAALTGSLEPANESYALAKIVGGRRCAYLSAQHGYAYRVAIPSNLYGPGDDFSAGRAHLVPAAIAKAHAAVVDGSSSIEVWGDGTARREFTYAGDLADWLVTQIGGLAGWPAALNLGAGADHTVREYYELAAEVTGFTGDLVFDSTKPSGVARRLLDSSAAAALGWTAPTPLPAGYAESYAQYLASERKASR